MKSSCISHPPKTPLVMIREEYLAICDGDHCQAAILNQFEYWTNIKLGYKEQAEVEGEIARAGGVEIPLGDLWIYKSQTELHDELMGLFGIRAVGTALQSLVDRGFLERRNNPKYAWDRTYQYRLQTQKVQDAILQKCKFEKSGAQSQRQQKGDIESDQNGAALPETTPEITPKETEEKKEPVSDFPENPPAPSLGGGADSGKEQIEHDDIRHNRFDGITDEPSAADIAGGDTDAGSQANVAPDSDSGKEIDDESTDNSFDGSHSDTGLLLDIDGHVGDLYSTNRVRDGDNDRISVVSGDSVVESIVDDFLNKPSPEDLARRAAAARAEAGNWADPGEDSVAHAGLVALHEAKGGSAPRKGTGTYDREIGAIRQALSDRDVTDPRVAVMAAQMFVEEKPKLACPHYKSFVGDYGEYLGRASGRVDKADARAPSRAPPEEYEPVYGGDLRPEDGPDQIPWNLTLDCLRAQVSQTAFFSYYRDTRLLSLEDGTAVVQARDGPQADFLQNRAKVIGKELSRILDRAVEVRFEVSDETA